MDVGAVLPAVIAPESGWYGVLKDFGFPVFVACYFMFRGDGLMREIRDELREANGKGRRK